MSFSKIDFFQCNDSTNVHYPHQNYGFGKCITAASIMKTCSRTYYDYVIARFHRDHERIEWEKFDSSGKYVSEREKEIERWREREKES